MNTPNRLPAFSKIKKIVLIEPDVAVRERYCELLRAEKYEVYSAADGKAGFDLVVRELPDLVLLEVLLPKMDGFEVLHRMNQKKEMKDIPVLLITELGHADDIARGRHLGASEYLLKGHHSPEQVVKKVMSILAAIKE
ncbi:MAG: response regulator [Candidatus Uhrbacteria bacterium]|nr:response regulator [Candidatus Uhrbacteria bacterium]